MHGRYSLRVCYKNRVWTLFYRTRVKNLRIGGWGCGRGKSLFWKTLIYSLWRRCSLFLKQSRTEELTRPVLGLGLRLSPFGRFPSPLSCGIATPVSKKARALPSEITERFPNAIQLEILKKGYYNGLKNNETTFELITVNNVSSYIVDGFTCVCFKIADNKEQV